MFTFLKGQYRTKVLGEYRKRLAAIYFGLTILCLLVLIGSVLPAFISLGSDRRAAVMERDTLSRKMMTGGQVEIENRAALIEKMLSVLKQDTDRRTLISVLESIFANQGDDVSLSGLSLEKKKDFWAVSLSGQASTREALVDFSKKLETVPSFSGVDLPVSSLAKSRNILFNISLKSQL